MSKAPCELEDIDDPIDPGGICGTFLIWLQNRAILYERSSAGSSGTGSSSRP
jgi:hypothetical protein